MNCEQRYLFASATESIDTAINCMQDLAGELADEGRTDQPVLDAIIDALIAIKHQVHQAEQTGEFPLPVPPNQLSLDMPNGKP